MSDSVEGIERRLKDIALSVAERLAMSTDAAFMALMNGIDKQVKHEVKNVEQKH